MPHTRRVIMQCKTLVVWSHFDKSMFQEYLEGLPSQLGFTAILICIALLHAFYNAWVKNQDDQDIYTKGMSCMR